MIINGKPRAAMILSLLVLFSASCATTSSQWKDATSRDDISAYEEFLHKHPRGELAELARARLEDLYAQRDWLSTRKSDDIFAYEQFLDKHPEGELAEQARARLEDLYAQRDWLSTRKSDDIFAYEDFLDRHPEGELAEQARARLQELSWINATQKNDILAYEWFLLNHPQHDSAAEARLRLEKLYTQHDWQEAMRSEEISAYEDFLLKHPHGPLADQVRSRLEAMRLDLNQWEEALAVATIQGYTRFLKLHPYSPFADKARGKIVDLEISNMLAGQHAELSPPNPIGEPQVRTYSVINIHNATDHNLTIRYSGPESFKVLFLPGEKASIELLQGSYKVVASVNAIGVNNYAGDEQLDGSDYEAKYYIYTSTASPYRPITLTASELNLTMPKLTLPPVLYLNPSDTLRVPEFHPWPSKRQLPSYWK